MGSRAKNYKVFGMVYFLFIKYLCFPHFEGLLDQAQERLKESAYLFGRVCDELHPEACYCLSLLAKVTFILGQAAEVGPSPPHLFLFRLKIMLEKSSFKRPLHSIII